MFQKSKDEDENHIRLPLKIILQASIAALDFVMIEMLSGEEIILNHFPQMVRKCMEFG